MQLQYTTAGGKNARGFVKKCTFEGKNGLALAFLSPCAVFLPIFGDGEKKGMDFFKKTEAGCLTERGICGTIPQITRATDCEGCLPRLKLKTN